MRFRSGSKTKKIFSLDLAYHIFYLHYSKNATNFHLQHLPHLLKILWLNSLCIFTISQRLAILLHPYRRLLYLCTEQLLQQLLQTSSLIAFSIFFYIAWQPSQIHLVAVKPFCLALQILLCDPTWLPNYVISYLPHLSYYPKGPLKFSFISQLMILPFFYFASHISHLTLLSKTYMSNLNHIFQYRNTLKKDTPIVS